jgi:hypothetical protein
VTEFPSDLNVTKYTPEERLETFMGVVPITLESLKTSFPEISCILIAAIEILFFML